jgi:hypothetical protein
MDGMSETSTPAADTAPAARGEKRAARHAARLARRIRAFAKAHGGSAEGTLEYLGQSGTRIVLVGADGGWGDVVAPRHTVAQQAVELAGITVHDGFDGEFAAKVRTGRYEWRRMAGIQAPGGKPGR